MHIPYEVAYTEGLGSPQRSPKPEQTRCQHATVFLFRVTESLLRSLVHSVRLGCSGSITGGMLLGVISRRGRREENTLARLITGEFAGAPASLAPVNSKCG